MWWIIDPIFDWAGEGSVSNINESTETNIFDIDPTYLDSFESSLLENKINVEEIISNQKFDPKTCTVKISA